MFPPDSALLLPTLIEIEPDIAPLPVEISIFPTLPDSVLPDSTKISPELALSTEADV